MLILNQFELISVLLKPKHINNMRVIKDFTEGPVKISIFHWNNKYLIKLEAGPLEQTFKLNEFDLESEDQVLKLIDKDFINTCIKRFDDMYGQLRASLERSEN